MAANRVPVDTIPEVKAFTEVEEKLAKFRQSNAPVFEQFESIAAEFNATLEQADKAVRAKNVSCGPFDAYQSNDQYDAEKLYELVGREEFLRLGGKVETVSTYALDRVKFKSMADSGKIPQDLVNEVYKKGFKYKAPKPIKL